MNHLSVALEFGKESILFTPRAKVPEPFEPYNTMRFAIENDDPHQTNKALAEAELETIFIVVFSGIREVIRLPVSGWMKQFNSFIFADMNLPARPVSSPVFLGGNPWLHGDGRRW